MGIASMAKDITELKQAEKELKDYRDHLEDLVREADLQIWKRQSLWLKRPQRPKVIFWPI